MKTQLPVIGGVRKVIRSTTVTPGTTIAELGATSVTLAQLAALISQIQQGQAPPNTQGSAAPVLLTLYTPTPWTDEGSNVEDAMIVPGPPGARGAQGVPGQFLMPEDGADGDWGPPGAPGATGAVGATGPQGPAGSGTGSGGTGVLLMMIPEDGQDGDWTPGPPGPAGATGARGLQGIQGQFLLPEDGADGDWGPPGAAGPQGATGATGSTGSVGPIGPQGVAIFLEADVGQDGDWGPPGVAGAAGATGATGSTGSVGPIGPQGAAIFLEADPGEQGDWTPGPQGPAGAVGATGPQGPAGTGTGGGAGTLQMFVLDDNIPSDEIQVPVPSSIGPLAASSLYVGGISTANNLLYMTGGATGVSTALIFANSNNALVICSGAAGVLKLAGANSVGILSAGTSIATFSQSSGISFSSTAAGVPTLTVQGSVTVGSSLGILAQAGSTNADYSLRCASNTGSVQFLEVYGDGGVTIGLAATKDMGAGTLNVQNGIYVGGAPVTPTRDMIPEDPYWEDEIYRGPTSGPGIFNGPVSVVSVTSPALTVKGPLGGIVIDASSQSSTSQFPQNLSLGSSGGDYPYAGYNFLASTVSTVYFYKVSDFASAIQYANGNLNFNTAPNGSAGAAIPWSIRMQITQAGGITGWGATAGGLVNMAPDSGSFSVIATGMGGSPSGIVQYRVMGNLVMLSFPTITSGSTSTSFTLTGLPVALQPARNQFVACPYTACEDNNIVGNGNMDIFILTGSGTMVMYKNGIAAGWTGGVGTPNKGIGEPMTIMYMLN